MAADECKQLSPECPIEDTIYGYVPNIGANAMYAMIFGLCAISQLYLLVKHWRTWKGYSTLVLLGAAGESAGYALRILLHNNPWDHASMTIQFLLLMVAPSFLAAALYTTLRSLVVYFGPQHTRLASRLWTWPFVTADLLGFVSQCAGGIVASMPELGTAGVAIMVTGVTLQAVVMAIAGGLAVDFALRVRRREGVKVWAQMPKNIRVFIVSLSVAFVLIFARCIYRIPELSGGVGGPLMRQEAEFMIFDGLLIMISVVLLCVVHPGIFAAAMRDGEPHAYDKTTPIGLDEGIPMCGGTEIPSGESQRHHQDDLPPSYHRGRAEYGARQSLSIPNHQMMAWGNPTSYEICSLPNRTVENFRAA